MKKILIFFLSIIISGAILAQKKTTTSAVITFDASTAIDDLPKAVNRTSIGMIDTKTGAVQFEAAVKNFSFSNPTIQGHFNGAKWMNSDEFPKFSFKGSIAEFENINFKKDGSYTANVLGELTVKNISNQVKVPVNITIKDKDVSATANFSIILSDYDIKGAPIDAGKVAKEPRITITAELK